MWTTPLGLPVVQPYRRKDRQHVRTLLQASPLSVRLLLPHRQELIWFLFCPVGYPSKGEGAAGLASGRAGRRAGAPWGWQPPYAAGFAGTRRKEGRDRGRRSACC